MNPSDRLSFFFELRFIITPDRNLKNMNFSQLGNYIRKIEDFESKYQLDNQDFIESLKNDEAFYSIVKETVKTLQQAKMYATYFEYALRNEETKIKNLPKESPQISSSSKGYVFKGNQKQIAFKRFIDLGLKPEETLGEYPSGRIHYKN